MGKERELAANQGGPTPHQLPSVGEKSEVKNDAYLPFTVGD